MAITPKITNIQKLQSWFFQTNKPAWSLYSGNRVAPNSTPFAINYTEIDTIGDSWNVLQNTLNNVDNVGSFVLVVSANKKDSAGRQNAVIELNPNAYVGGAMQGIGNPYGTMPMQMQMMQGMGAMTKMSPEVQNHIDREVQRRVADEKRLMEMDYKMKLQDMKFQNNRSHVDKLIDGLAKNPTGSIAALSGLFRGTPAPRPQLGVLEGSGTVEAEVSNTETQSNQGNFIDFNKIVHGCITLHKQGVIDIDDVILMLAQLSKKDANLVKTQIAMIKGAIQSELEK